eukprot:TRINITY_DN13883_c0_g1_i3.p1 TRINITY_DN13883_c0_g1~~TRINITY_DN13883_c0_g1_i3.p1  ORF type:complete len:221 (+),score=20.83 TRINITY_DN13883_c0_g1_i3:78-665(+)
MERKRARDENLANIDEVESSSCAKRVEAERLSAGEQLLLHMLEEDDEGDEAEDMVKGVMKSLEQEISSVNGPEKERESPSEERMELGFLLEASDDELGIPPTEQDKGDCACAAAEASVSESFLDDEEPPAASSARPYNDASFWQMEDDVIPPYEMYELGLCPPDDNVNNSGRGNEQQADAMLRDQLFFNEYLYAI